MRTRPTVPAVVEAEAEMVVETVEEAAVLPTADPAVLPSLRSGRAIIIMMVVRISTAIMIAVTIPMIAGAGTTVAEA
jgi:hypothetical protein